MGARTPSRATYVPARILGRGTDAACAEAPRLAPFTSISAPGTSCGVPPGPAITTELMAGSALGGW